MNKSKPPIALIELLEDLSLIEDREMKSEVLIEYAERFSEVPGEVAQRPFDESNRVPACESEAFIFTTPVLSTDSPQKVTSFKLHFAVENPQGISAKALAVILDETLSGAPIEQIQAIEEDLVFTIFGAELSMGKGLGLKSMVRLVKELTSPSRNEALPIH